MDEWSQYKYEQARAWLEHIAKLKHATEDAAKMRELFESIAENVRGIDYTREHVSSSLNVHRLEEALCKVDEATVQWAANQAAFIDEAIDAANRIAQLEDAAERRALHLHYVDGHTWERVCVQMEYSWQRMMEIRKSAVTNVYEFMPNEWRDPLYPATD